LHLWSLVDADPRRLALAALLKPAFGSDATDDLMYWTCQTVQSTLL